MAIVVWPVTLPSPQLLEYDLEPNENIARTKMESGNARQRRRFTRVGSVASVAFKMSSYQFSIFEAWYKYKAKEGAEYFSLNILVGLGYIPHEVRFISPYKAKPLSDDQWNVTVTIELREQYTYDEGALEIILNGEITIDQLEEYSNRLHTLIHIDLAPGGQYEWA